MAAWLRKKHPIWAHNPSQIINNTQKTLHETLRKEKKIAAVS